MMKVDVAQLNKSRRRDDPRLHGRWQLVRHDGPEMDVGEGVEMEFTPDGRLTYAILGRNDRRQAILLHYEADGGEIASDQRSAPATIRTAYAIEPDGMLRLDYGGSRSWYRRADE